MRERRIDDLARALRTRGIDPGHLSELQEELDVIEKPPGLFGRLTKKLRDTATNQWRNVIGELQESREVMGLLTTRLRGGELTPEDRDKVRAQMLDVLKVVPAGVIAAANAALPLPGTSAATPWLLARLGLMPSRWREAHLLYELKREQERLRVAGHLTAAAEIGELLHDLEEEADAREEAARDAALLTWWDADKDGQWDLEERENYRAELVKLDTLAKAHGAARRWFLQYEGQIFGPVRLTEMTGLDVDPSLLACFDGKTGWVSLRDVLSGESSV